MGLELQGKQLSCDQLEQGVRAEMGVYSSHLSRAYLGIGLGGDLSMAELTLPMYELLAHQYGSKLAIEDTERIIQTRFEELLAKWLERHDAGERQRHRRHLLERDSWAAEVIKHNLSGDRGLIQEYTRLVANHSRIGVGGGTSLAHLVMGAFDLLAMEVPPESVIDTAMYGVHHHLEMLALRWREVLNMAGRDASRERACGRLEWAGVGDCRVAEAQEGREGRWEQQEPMPSTESCPADGLSSRSGENGEF